LADILKGRAPARNDAEALSVFSPFGLGVLDLAVSKLVRDLALQQQLETVIPSFVPSSWVEEA
jgi:ornithine cyclodeaminase